MLKIVLLCQANHKYTHVWTVSFDNVSSTSNIPYMRESDMTSISELFFGMIHFASQTRTHRRHMTSIQDSASTSLSLWSPAKESFTRTSSSWGTTQCDVSAHFITASEILSYNVVDLEFFFLDVPDFLPHSRK